MPVLLQARNAKPQIRFLWVNQGEAPDVVSRFATQHGLPHADVVLDTVNGWNYDAWTAAGFKVVKLGKGQR